VHHPEPDELQLRTTALGAALLAAVALAATGCSSCSRTTPAAGRTVEEAGTADEITTAPRTVTVDDACSEFSAAVCGRMKACTPFLLQAVYGDTKTCAARSSLQCKPMLAAPGSQALSPQIELCAKVISSEGCDEALDNPQPSACDIGGALAEGAPCAAGQQCQTAYCKTAAGGVCGTCVKRVGSRYACTVDGDCVAGLVCDRGACAAPGGPDAPCGGGLPACSRALTCISGVCKKPSPAGARCVSPTDCDGNQGLYCNILTRQCTQTHVAGTNQACGIVGNSLVGCTAGATCFRARCMPPAADGASCDPMNGLSCLAPAQCISGKCLVPDPASCR
jgi:hypothetical protein